MSTPLTLNQLLDHLPKELHDRIYIETFCTPSYEIYIDRSWRPPSIAYVNRSMRKKFYCIHKFILPDQETFDAWSHSHRGLWRDVRKIRFEIIEPRVQGMKGGEYFEMEHGIIASYLL
ncbi:hypothetical protein HII31_02008 [Pseudocercospora fuligena]|uniref:Uncharacterized protein n=1 Tax=Pseudocercospora fuligena TaxID=685502 RepID=A0A8H6RSR1_9PEZI|nr:hypothetical protein HII31_02008 [Pseudocercospora fuligena]